VMGRYLIERTFPHGMELTYQSDSWSDVIDQNRELGVTWLHTYVSEDRKTVFCIYDGPDPETIRRASAQNGLPVERIFKVSVLTPYPHHDDRGK
jgi:hypothetical protein